MRRNLKGCRAKSVCAETMWFRHVQNDRQISWYRNPYNATLATPSDTANHNSLYLPRDPLLADETEKDAASVT